MATNRTALAFVSAAIAGAMTLGVAGTAAAAAPERATARTATPHPHVAKAEAAAFHAISDLLRAASKVCQQAHHDRTKIKPAETAALQHKLDHAIHATSRAAYLLKHSSPRRAGAPVDDEWLKKAQKKLDTQVKALLAGTKEGDLIKVAVTLKPLTEAALEVLAAVSIGKAFKGMKLPNVPGLPKLPDLPKLPGLPETPKLPEFPGLPKIF